MGPVPRRREFLKGCGGCLLASACAAWGQTGADRRPIRAPQVRPRLRLVFSHIPPEKATWPYQGYDYEGRKRELTRKLAHSCPNVDFFPTTAHSAEEGKALLAQDGEIDGYLIHLIGIWSGAWQPIAAAGRPVLLVNDLYAGDGEFLIAYARARREKWRVAGVSSSRWEDVVEAVRAFEVLRKMDDSVMLAVLDRSLGAEAKAIQSVFGTEVKALSSAELNEAYNRADPAEARQHAAAWIRGAQKVVEPSDEEIGKSGRMYVAMRDLMAGAGAQAITVDCLNLFYDGKLPAYPCLGFFQLNNDGWVGACEADLASTVTMLAMSYLAGRPGFISDPVVDTAAGRVIYAHCVAPSKVLGPGGLAILI